VASRTIGLFCTCARACGTRPRRPRDAGRDHLLLPGTREGLAGPQEAAGPEEGFIVVGGVVERADDREKEGHEGETHRRCER
jgi:hypothetical protein